MCAYLNVGTESASNQDVLMDGKVTQVLACDQISSILLLKDAAEERDCVCILGPYHLIDERSMIGYTFSLLQRTSVSNPTDRVMHNSHT